MVRSGQRHPAESADRQRRHAAKQLSVILPGATGAEGNGSRLARATVEREAALCRARSTVTTERDGGMMSSAAEVEEPAGADTNHIGVPQVNVIAQPRARQDAGGGGHILGKGGI
jgi:hypothetical protein